MPPALTPLILASSSPYRKELLTRLRVPFTCIHPEVEESAQPGEAPAALAQRLALLKAQTVAQKLVTDTAPALIIGSDQVASFEQHVLGKPGTHERALQQLLWVQGKSVIFYTALCVLNTQTQKSYAHLAVNEVRFRSLPEAQLDAYLRLEQPYDCAGSAKSEGLGIALIETMQGDDPNALVGLPLIALVSALQHFGYPILGSENLNGANAVTSNNAPNGDFTQSSANGS